MMFVPLLNVCALPQNPVIYSAVKCEKCKLMIQTVPQFTSIQAATKEEEENIVATLPDLIISHCRPTSDPASRISSDLERAHLERSSAQDQETFSYEEVGKKLRKIADSFRSKTSSQRVYYRLRRNRKSWIFCLVAIGTSGYLLIRFSH